MATNAEDSPNSATSNPENSVQTPLSTEDSSNSATSNAVISVQPPPSTGGLRLFSILTGKTNDSHKKFTDTLINRFQDLREVSTVDQSNIVLVFCPIVSRAGTDIEAALKTFTDSTASKLKVLVVLHHTFDKEKTVPDSSRCVNREDILTVDCLFYEDTGLLECQRNQDAMDNVVNWLREQGPKRGLNVSLRKTKGCAPNSDTSKQRNSEQTSSTTNKDDASNSGTSKQRNSDQTPPTTELNTNNTSNVEQRSINNPAQLKKQGQERKQPPLMYSEGLRPFPMLTEKTNNSDKKFTEILINQIQDLKEVTTVDESNIVLVFCPIVSRAETDIEAALKRFTDSTASKLNVLVVLHHTHDPEKTVPDSSRCVKRTDILTVDCLYYEDTGLLECQKNCEAMDKVVNWLIEQGEKRGVNVSRKKSSSDYFSTFKSLLQWVSSGNNPKPEGSSSSRQVKYSFILIGDTHKSHVDFIQALQEQIPGLKEVYAWQERDVILFFCPVLAGFDSHSALQKLNKRKDKLAVLIFLHYKLDAAFVPDNSEIVNKPNVFVVDYVFYDTIGQPASQMKRNAVYAVSHWLNTKMA